LNGSAHAMQARQWSASAGRPIWCLPPHFFSPPSPLSEFRSTSAPPSAPRQPTTAGPHTTLPLSLASSSAPIRFDSIPRPASCGREVQAEPARQWQVRPAPAPAPALLSAYLTGFSSPPSRSCAAAGGDEAQGRRRRGRGEEEERVAGGGREQALGGGLLPALHAFLAHSLPRCRRPLQALRGAPPSRLIHLVLCSSRARRMILGWFVVGRSIDWVLHWRSWTMWPPPRDRCGWINCLMHFYLSTHSSWLLVPCAEVHGAGVPDPWLGVHRAGVPHPPIPRREGNP